MRKLCLAGTAVLLILFSGFLFLIVFPVGGPALPCGLDGVEEGVTPPPSAPAQSLPDPEARARAARAQEIDRIVGSLSDEALVGQLFWARCPETDGAAQVAAYQPAGYLLFARDFEGRTADTVTQVIQSYQDAAALPLLIGVDEEGGTVVRASRYLRDIPFRSPQQVYAAGGMDAIRADTADKDAFLHSLGINVNLAPVADVSTDPADFIYSRAFGGDAAATAAYVRAVVQTMVDDRMGAVLKHFPGYGPNADTHTGSAVDERSAETLRTQDFLPFSAGIQAGAGAVLVSHNVVTAFDAARPASLSPAVHEALREELGFDGVAVTDDLAMEAVTGYAGDADAAVLAVQAGNDLLISSDFPAQHAAVLAALQSGTLSRAQLEQAAGRVIGWKLDLGLIS